MKSFKEFVIEKSEADSISKKDAANLQRMARPETSSSSAERIRRGLDPAQVRMGRKTRRVPSALTQSQIAGAWKSGSEGKSSVMATSSKPEGGTWFGSSKKAIEKGQEEIRQQVRDTIAKNRGGSAELQAAQSSGPKETMVGKGAKPGTGETYRASRPSETRATGVSNLPPKGQSRGRTGSKQFSGDAKYKEMLANIPDAKPTKPRTRTVKQSNVSQQASEFRADYKTPKGEKAYQKTKVDIDTRKAFPTGKGGLKADEANPYVKREVRQARSARLGGDVWDQPKGSSEPFKGQGKSPSKTTYPSFFKPTKPNITASRISKTAAPDRSATKQAVQFLKNLKRNSSSASTPKNATTHGVGPDGKYLSPEMRKSVHKNRNVTDVVKYQESPKAKKKTGGGLIRKPSADALQRAVIDGNKARKSKELASIAKGPSKFGKAVRGLGKFTGPAAAGIDVAMGYSDERAKGASKKRSLAKGVTKALGGALGGTLGAVGGGGLGSAALGVAGYTAGSELAGRAFDVAAGATAKQKSEIAKQSRVKQRLQSVVRPTKTTSVEKTGIVTRRTAVDPTKLAKTKVIRDKSGTERVGYLVKKGSTYGYKHGADPSTLARTSSNPLERIGRTLMPGAYVQSDESARKKRVAALKAKG